MLLEPDWINLDLLSNCWSELRYCFVSLMLMPVRRSQFSKINSNSNVTESSFETALLDDNQLKVIQTRYLIQSKTWLQKMTRLK